MNREDALKQSEQALEELAEALARRYTERARATLGDPSALSANEAIKRLNQLFRDALLKDDKMCLCGLFGAERDTLPHEVAIATGEFFRFVLAYLTTAFGPKWTGEPPAATLARLEGALILARTLNDAKLFEQSVATIPGGR